MALVPTKTETGADVPASPQTTAAALDALDIDNIDAEMQALKAKSANRFTAEVDDIDNAIIEVGAPDVGTVYMFSCVTDPESTFMIYPNAPDVRKRHVGDRVTTKEDDPMAIQIKFNAGRFMTNDPRLAKLIEFSAVAWPTFYGCITSGHGKLEAVAKRVHEMRAKAAYNLTADALADDRDKPLLDQADALIRAKNFEAAEGLLEAVELVQAQRAKNTLVVEKETA